MGKRFLKYGVIAGIAGIICLIYILKGNIYENVILSKVLASAGIILVSAAVLLLLLFWVTEVFSSLRERKYLYAGLWIIAGIILAIGFRFLY